MQIKDFFSNKFKIAKSFFVKKINKGQKTATFAVVSLSLALVVGGAYSTIRIATTGAPPVGEFDAGTSLIFDGRGTAINENLPDIAGTVDVSIRSGKIVPDGAGGYLTSFNIYDSGSVRHLVVQKFDATGARQWGEGVEVATDVDEYFGLVSDGAGGAIAVWTKDGVFAERINSSGTAVFGTPISLANAGDCSGSGNSFDPQNQQNNFAISDNAGGLTTLWRGNNSAKCVQRMDSTGGLLWGADANIFSTDDGVYYLLNDTGNGAWIADSNGNTMLWHLDQLGATIAGCPIDAGLGDLLTITPDGNDGVVFVSSGSNPVAMRYDSACVPDPAWPVGGRSLTNRFSYRSANVVVFGSNVAIVWREGNFSTVVNQNIKASLLNLADGTVVWNDVMVLPAVSGIGSGIADSLGIIQSGADYIFTAIHSMGSNEPNGRMTLVKLDGITGNQIYSTPVLTLDDLVITSVSDGASGLVTLFKRNSGIIYSQHFDGAGVALWLANNSLITAPVTSPLNRYLISQPGKVVAAPSGQKAIFWQTYNEHFNDVPTLARSTQWMKLMNLDGTPIGGGDGVFAVDIAEGRFASSTLLDASADSTGFYVLVRHDSGEVLQYIAYKFDLNGNAVWGVNGIPLDDNLGVGGSSLESIRMIADNTGGAFIGISNNGFKVIRINSAGAYVWNGSAGIQLAASSPYFRYFIIPDDVGGIYAAWSVNGAARFSHFDSAGVLDPAFSADPNGGTIGLFNSMVYAVVPDGLGNFYLPYVADYNTQYVQKMSSTGQKLWGANGKMISRDYDFHNAVQIANAFSIGDRGFIISWVTGEQKRMIQSFDPNGNKRWGPTFTARLSTALTGGEGVITVDSTTGFRNVGDLKIGDTIFRYSGKDATHFYSTEGVPSALLGDTVTQMPGLRVSDKAENDYDINWPYVAIEDGGGGAVIAYGDYESASNLPFGAKIAYVDRNGVISFGGPRFIVTSEPAFQSAASISMVRNNDKTFLTWVARPNGANGIYLYAQQYSSPAQPNASGVDIPSAPKQVIPEGQSAPVVATKTGITYFFENPGSAISIKLAEVKPDGTKIDITVNNEPNATSITETGLIPNTSYTDRVVIPVNDRGEGNYSEKYPPIVTLQNSPTGGLAGLDKDKNTVTVVPLGIFPNLTVGNSGIKFTELGSGTTSGWIQTPIWQDTNLVVGQTYQIEVQTRNSDGVLSPPVTFTVTPTTSLLPKIKLNKAVEIFKAIPTEGLTEDQVNIFPDSGRYLREVAIVPVETLVEKTDPTVIAQSLDISGKIESAGNSFFIRSDSGELVPVDLQKDKAVLRYTITVTNEGSSISYNTIITDKIPATLRYQPESVYMDNKIFTDALDTDEVSFDPTVSTLKVVIAELGPGEIKTFSFDSVLLGESADIIKNKATAVYSDEKWF